MSMLSNRFDSNAKNVRFRNRSVVILIRPLRPSLSKAENEHSGVEEKCRLLRISYRRREMRLSFD